MSKQKFKDTLAYGKCRCGEAGQEPKVCYHRPINNCNCCFICRLACEQRERDMTKMLDYMAKIAREEIDAEILEALKNPKK